MHIIGFNHYKESPVRRVHILLTGLVIWQVLNAIRILWTGQVIENFKCYTHLWTGQVIEKEGVDKVIESKGGRVTGKVNTVW